MPQNKNHMSIQWRSRASQATTEVTANGPCDPVLLSPFPISMVRVFHQAWRILSGHANEINSLTCAASTSMEADANGRTMFDVAFTQLEKAK